MIDIARYLSIWLFDLHMPESDFWRRMNPKRLSMLLAARFRPAGHPEVSQSTETGEKQPKSLSQYIMGG